VCFLFEQAVDVIYKVTPLDVQCIPIVDITEGLLVAAIWILDQLLRNQPIFDFAQAATKLYN
jgi:hypothetical protein